MLTQAALFIWTATAIQQTPASTFDLALRVPEGSSYDMKVVSATTQTMEGQGLEKADGSYTLTLGQRFAFGRNTGEGIPLNVTTNSVDVKVAGTVDIDDQAIKETLTGLEMAFSVSPQAETLKLEMLGEITTDPARKAIIASQTDLLKQTGPFGLVYPKAPISVGSTWNHQIDLADALKNAGQGTILPEGETKATVAFKTLSIDVVDGKTVIKIQGDVTGIIKFQMRVSGVNFAGTMTTTSKTIYTVDGATGLMLKSEATGTAQSSMPIFTVTQKSEVVSTVTPAP